MLRNIYHRYGMWQHLKNRMRKKLHVYKKWPVRNIAKDMQPGSTLKSKLVGDRGKGFKKSLGEKEKWRLDMWGWGGVRWGGDDPHSFSVLGPGLYFGGTRYPSEHLDFFFLRTRFYILSEDIR